MAEQEHLHAIWFERRYPVAVSATADQHVVEMGRQLLMSIVENQTFSFEADKMARQNDIQEVLKMAVEFEQDTIVFYEMMAGFLDTPQTIGELNKIIEEERGHIQKLQNYLVTAEG